MSRARVGAAISLVVACGALAVGARLRHGRDAGAGAGPDRPRVRPADPEDPLPFDGWTRLFETRRHAGEGFLLYETQTSEHERLPDGRESVVLETRVKTRGTLDGRLVSREWLVRDRDSVLCTRRQEGPVVSELEPAQPVLVFPLSAGKTWSWAGRAGGRPCHMRTAVIGREQVVVGAGTFDGAWRMDSEVTSDDDPRSIVRRSFWVKPGLGMVAERSSVATELRTLDLDAALLRVTEP